MSRTVETSSPIRQGITRMNSIYNLSISAFIQFLVLQLSSISLVFSRGHATLHLTVSVGRSVRRSVTFLNCERILLYCSCPTVRDWIAVYSALFLSHQRALVSTILLFTQQFPSLRFLCLFWQFCFSSLIYLLSNHLGLTCSLCFYQTLRAFCFVGQSSFIR